ncbi:MAG: hypothetical protein ABI601_21355 [bacterium]
MSDLDAARKSWATLRAVFAIAGYAIDRLSAERGYRIARGAWSVDLPDLRSVCDFAARAGICLPEVPYG